MSNSEMRVYQIIKNDDATAVLEFRVLATKEKEFVISNIEKTASFQALIDGSDQDDEFSRFNWKVGNNGTTEEMLTAYAQQRTDLDVKKTWPVAADIYIAP